MNAELYLRRHNKVIVPTASQNEALSDALLVTLQMNIESFGYTLSPRVLSELRFLDEVQISRFYKEIVDILKHLVGDDVKHSPMYPNFPRQVADTNNTELYINAYIHYYGSWLGTRWLPEFETQPREKLDEKVKLTTIELGDGNDFNSIFTNLAQSKSSMSQTDREDVEWFVKKYGETILALLPHEMPNKENAAIICSALIVHTSLPVSTITSYFKTATDVLRLMSALSLGDVSLAEPIKFKVITRPERRLFLGMLETIENITEDMLRYKEQWKRAGERLHPGEYENRFPKTAKAFKVLRENEKFETFNSTLEKYLKAGQVTDAITLLKSRPGELARKLDLLLRSAKNPNEVIDAFAETAPQVSSSVLLQLFAHLKDRNKPRDIRVFFPKGNVGKAVAVANELPKLNEDVRQKAIDLCKNALRTHFTELSPLGKVYVDRQLKRFNVPFAIRSTSRALRTVGRGSRLDIPSGNTLRFFIWWKDGKDRTDIDLSALCLGDDSSYKLELTYYNLKEAGGVHSGDITSAPDGASEFIDLDIQKMIDRGVRFVVMSVNAYTMEPFKDLPECFAGFMIRQAPQSGEIYEPRTVENKIDLASDSRVCVPMIIDLKKRTAIWTDLSLSHNLSRSNNVFNNLSTLTIINKTMQSLSKPNLYDLFTLHGEARGEIVTTPEEADVVFGLEKGITPFDTDKIVGEYL